MPKKATATSAKVRRKAAAQPSPSVPPLPDKLYYRIGEAAQLLGVRPHVLRYWETEFRVLKPTKSGSQHRLYRPRDIAILTQIKQLLYDDRLTIEGARKRLRELNKKDTRQGELPLPEVNFRAALVRIRRDLQALRKFLDG